MNDEQLVTALFDIFLIFLQSLHNAYHTNYFIDLFGWFSNVHIGQSGLLLRDAVWEPKNWWSGKKIFLAGVVKIGEGGGTIISPAYLVDCKIILCLLFISGNKCVFGM